MSCARATRSLRSGGGRKSGVMMVLSGMRGNAPPMKFHSLARGLFVAAAIGHTQSLTRRKEGGRRRKRKGNRSRDCAARRIKRDSGGKYSPQLSGEYCRLHYPASWLPLAAGTSSCNLLLTIPLGSVQK